MSQAAAIVSPLHALVAEAWKQVLHSHRCDPAQSWEEAGGDSLATLHLLLKLERSCGRILAFDMITPEMRVGDLVTLIEEGPRSRTAGRPMVHLIPGFFGEEPRLANFRRALSSSMSFNLVDIADLNEPATLLRDMRLTGALAARAIGRRQSSGPILLAGFSFGGGVAYEAARVLIESGREVAFLGILDTTFGLAATGAKRTLKQTLRWNVRSMLRLALSWDLARTMVLRAVDRFSWSTAYGVRRYLAGLFREHTLHDWAPTPLDVETFLAVSEEFGPKTLTIWRRLCTRLRVVQLPGSHLRIFQAPGADVLVPAFENSVRAASAMVKVNS